MDNKSLITPFFIKIIQQGSEILQGPHQEAQKSR
jgi:hypothetical protein